MHPLRCGAISADHGLSLCLAAPGISAAPSEENLRYYNVMILGPQASPYEGEGPAAPTAVSQASVCLLQPPQVKCCVHGRRHIQAGALPARGLPHGCSQGACER
jgi:hypothetical protein